MQKKLAVKGVVLMLIVLLSACFHGQKISRSEANRSSGEPTIVFLVFKISNDSVQEKSAIELISQTQSFGRIKEEHEQPEEISDYLTLEVIESGQRPQRIQMEHPLHRQIEYVDEQEVLATKVIDLDQAEFFVRIQVYGKSAQVRVSETLEKTKSRVLQSFKIEGK